MKNAFVNVKGLATATLAMGLALGAQAGLLPDVKVEIPKVEGAKAEFFVFRPMKGGWDVGNVDAVVSGIQARVVWTTVDPDKSLTAPGVVNAFRWSETFFATGAVNTVTAPTVTSGESEIKFSLDTRERKLYYDAADVLPIWYAQGEDGVFMESSSMGDGLVLNPSSTNTLSWIPDTQDVYYFTHGKAKATITYQLPVEVNTNDLEIVGTKNAVTYADVEDPKAGDFKPLPEDGIIGSNDTVKVVYTVADADKYFVDGLTTYETTFSATQDVNVVSAMIEKPVAPKAPCVRLSTVAQHYPWNNTVDVTYQALYTPAKGYAVTIDVTADGAAGGASQTVDAKTGISTVSFDSGVIGTSFSEMNTKEAKVKVKIQKVQ